MGDPLFLAVDSGTTRMKAALLDARGRKRALVDCSLPVSHPFDGASEMDMPSVWAALCGLTRNLAERHPALWPDLAGMAVSGQGDGLWPVDRAGEPVRPAILWNDTRARRLDLPEGFEIEAFSRGNAVTPPFPGAVHLLLLWLRRNEPEGYQRIHCALHCKDWLAYRLTGELATDYTDASTAVMNVLERRYVGELLERMGIPEALGRLPDPRPAGSPLGRITPAASRQSGLPPGLPVLTGALDVAAVAAGAGAVLPGDAVAIVGTTLGNAVVLGRDQVDHTDSRGSTLCHVHPERYLRLMATSSGTGSLDWVRRLVAPDLAFTDLEPALARIPLGCEGAMFHPYLHGERAPFRNPLACGGFNGLTERHTPMHLLRAAHEGLALSFRDCQHYLPAATRMTISGGGAASDLLCQMFADCLNRPVHRPGFSELGLAGTAQLVWRGLGYAGDLPLQEDTPPREFLPDPVRHERFEDLYALFLTFRAGVEPYWLDRASMFPPCPGK
jgi:sugar (pentulose or hexulose) kinase